MQKNDSTLSKERIYFMYNKEPQRRCSYSILKQKGVHDTRVEHLQLPYQNIELWHTPNSLPTPSSSNNASLMILITAVPWKKGEASFHGAREMVCREGANSKKHRRGDHGAVALTVSHQVDGMKVIMKDDCSWCVVLMNKATVSLERIRKIHRYK